MSTTTPPATSMDAPPRRRSGASILQGDIARRALTDSLAKLDPRVQVRNPVMFVVEIGAVITSWAFISGRRQRARRPRPRLVHLHDLRLAVADGGLCQPG